jgi:phi13 family phage major tail protein
MARIGLKGLTYAPYTSGGDGSAVVYGTVVTAAGLMITADLSLEREDVSLYADDARQEHANGVTGGTMTLELADLSDALKKALLGYVENADGALTVIDAEAPYVGFGYITKQVKNGTASFVGYWINKIQFGTDSDSNSTKGENSEFRTESLTGSMLGVQLTSGGATEFYRTKSFATEAAAAAWVANKGVTPST